MQTSFSKATLGGGCFWCLEAIFQRVQGVQSARSGYSGDTKEKANYQLVCSKTTKHAEVVQVEFNESELSFKDVLTIFFNIHDPTTLNRQGNDEGPQYRSVVFYHDEKQKLETLQMIQELNEQKVNSFLPFYNQKMFSSPIVTEVAKFEELFYAEEYHSNYFNDHPQEGYCRAVVDPKVRKFMKKFNSQLKPNYKL